MDLGNIGTVSSMRETRWYNTGKIYKSNSVIESPYAEKEKDKLEKQQKMRDLIRGNSNKNKSNSIMDSMHNYGDQIRASRNNSKSTVNEIKKLKYNFKDISSQIRKAKTSVNAKQVASKARREVVQLKAKLQTGKYDEEELQAAIEHAKSMERAAKKKARHLEEEELVKITDKAEGAGLSAAELEQELEDKSEEAIEDYEAELEESKEELEFNEEIYDLLLDTMGEMMEEVMENTLEELVDGMMTISDYEMTEDEYKNFKVKHRNSEEKSMLEADTKYLKAIFDIYDKRMSGGNPGIGAAPVCVDNSFSIPNIVDVSV